MKNSLTDRRRSRALGLTPIRNWDLWTVAPSAIAYFFVLEAAVLTALPELLRPVAERHALRDGVPRHALKLPFRGGTVRDLARRALEISAHGLARRARLNRSGADERVHLEPLLEIVDANQTPADRKLELFHGPWKHSVDPLFYEYAY